MTSFLGLAPALALVGFLFFAPGAALLRVRGYSNFFSVSAAPVVSVPMVVAGSAMLRLVGVRLDGPLGPGLMVALWVALLALGRATRPPRVVTPNHQPPRLALFALVVAAVLVVFAAGLAVTLGSPLAWPQTPDNIFHVGAVTWMVRHGSGWVGDVSQYSGLADSPVSYPGAWHSVVALTATWSGVSPLAASHAAVMVVGGLVWPVSVILLVWWLAGPTKWAIVGAGASSLVISGMPYYPESWSAWPFLLGTALLPVVVVALYQVISTRNRHLRVSLDPAILCAMAVISASLAHPSSMYVVALLAPVVAMPILWPTFSLRGRVTSLAVVVVTWLVLWSVRPTQMLEVAASPSEPLPAAAARLLTVTSPVPAFGLLTGAAIVIGATLTCRTRTRVWVIAAIATGWMAASLFFAAPQSWRTAVAWPWWGDLARLSAVVAVPSAVALSLLVDRLGALVKQNRGSSITYLSVVGMCSVVAATLVTTNFLLVRVRYYPPDDAGYWVTSSGRQSLATLAQSIPEGAVVAADPYSGGTHLYLTRDVRLLFPTEWKPLKDPGLLLLSQHLGSIRTDARVCAEANRRGLTYVVTGSTPATLWSGDENPLYTGLTTVDQASGFTPVERAGDYRLWKVPACDS